MLKLVCKLFARRIQTCPKLDRKTLTVKRSKRHVSWFRANCIAVPSVAPVNNVSVIATGDIMLIKVKMGVFFYCRRSQEDGLIHIADRITGNIVFFWWVRCGRYMIFCDLKSTR